MNIYIYTHTYMPIYCATSLKVAGSNPEGCIGIFH